MVWPCFLIALFLLGCTVGPNFRAPKAAVAPEWIEARDNRVSQASAVYRSWWRFPRRGNLTTDETGHLKKAYRVPLVSPNARSLCDEDWLRKCGLWIWRNSLPVTGWLNMRSPTPVNTMKSMAEMVKGSGTFH